jgi:hypothetical protein
MLTDQLGIKESQAQGGAGLIFNLAKEKLGGGDFSKIADVIPGIGDMMKSAPDSGGGLMGAIGGLASSFGGDSLGNLAQLAGGFSKLGLDSGMIGKFIPIILSFVEGKGGESIKALLEKVLK